MQIYKGNYCGSRCQMKLKILALNSSKGVLLQADGELVFSIREYFM